MRSKEGCETLSVLCSGDRVGVSSRLSACPPSAPGARPSCQPAAEEAEWTVRLQTRCRGPERSPQTARGSQIATSPLLTTACRLGQCRRREGRGRRPPPPTLPHRSQNLATERHLAAEEAWRRDSAELPQARPCGHVGGVDACLARGARRCRLSCPPRRGPAADRVEEWVWRDAGAGRLASAAPASPLGPSQLLCPSELRWWLLPLWRRPRSRGPLTSAERLAQWVRSRVAAFCWSWCRCPAWGWRKSVEWAPQQLGRPPVTCLGCGSLFLGGRPALHVPVGPASQLPGARQPPPRPF